MNGSNQPAIETEFPNMRRQFLSLILAVALTASPSIAMAEGAAPAGAVTPAAVDIALRPEGLLIGQLVSASGEPLAGKEVKLGLSDGREASAKTNSEGGFAFRGAKGVMVLASDKSRVVVRGWSPKTAPPSATPALLLVETEGLVRGQHYAGTGTQAVVDKSKRLFANPLFVAGVIGTAVAIPVAIANNDDDPAS